MHFNTFLEKHYLHEDLKNLKKLLQQLGIEQQLEKYINDYFNNTRQSSIENAIVQLSFTISNFTATINKSLSPLTDTKEEASNVLVELGIRLIKETYIASHLPKDTYFNTLRFSLEKVYFKYGWDFRVLSEILNLDKLHSYSRTTLIQNNKIAGRKKTYFEWKHKDFSQEQFFEDIEETFKLKKRKSNISLLFDGVITDFTIIIHSKYLESFLVLIQHLYNEDIIGAKGNKGYLSYLQNHLQPPQKDKHPVREYKKICKECLQNKTKCKLVETHISYMLRKYSKKGLLD